MRNPVFVALDLPSQEAALTLARDLAPVVGGFKIGSELFTNAGPDIVRAIRATGAEVFLDLKFHDIPNTVAKAVAAATRLDVQMLTIHTSGGLDMMRAAEESAQAAAKKAATADIVVFSTGPQQRVPERFQQWIELWLPKREEHDGVLVNLFPAVPPAEVASPAMSLYLRSIAHRAGMDYLTGVPEGISHPIPESLDSCTQRAEQVTTLLDEILHSPLPTASMPLVY